MRTGRRRAEEREPCQQQEQGRKRGGRGAPRDLRGRQGTGTVALALIGEEKERGRPEREEAGSEAPAGETRDDSIE